MKETQSMNLSGKTNYQEVIIALLKSGYMVNARIIYGMSEDTIEVTYWEDK